MYVRHLSVRDFRSWRSLELDLQPETTIFVGRNGFGKTNILEALYYLTNLRSHRVSTDAPLVQHGAASAVIAATVEHNGRELTAELTVNAAGANKARINGSPARRPRELIGILRSVMFAPEDLLLVRGDPADRRRFVDELVAGQGPRWVAARADYDKVLRQRTALLKTAGAAMRRGGGEAASVISTLDVWDGQLADLGAQITAARIDVLAALRPHVVTAYASIAPHSRPADLRYRPAAGPHLLPGPGESAAPEEIRAHLLAGLAELRNKEIERGVCLVGPHRDDVDVVLGDQVAKGFASHGESWSLALSLRLGSVELLRADGIEPVIMLDDVFAELDAARRRQLVEFTASAQQLLITAAVAEDIPDGLGGRTLDIDTVTDDTGRYSRITTLQP
ncbi:DNA replication/repair protein RecF [Gordonia amarae]|uniref:DNA replication and repair protein RecF n=2 Tax=Gordonia amarae TaxID=36821 RepID=G7GQA2_9ACTN|nr:DNA replication/repair protein RecF [Gordonia amarae]MCS3876718.1 DNA replication and repair protein RecF [Gordonia amarae]QHN15577.1 DNA replication/repair protein RecF [Gordonia amarae]QHN20147.1 DNA replication/repair protein RecF [Gordonia amarae]QHN28997.1 DNA replication/repair protein RecF [Gordonia amarae]QHN37778.1 DNA replication/repair protein RecF [Gordonia amarae]